MTRPSCVDCHRRPSPQVPVDRFKGERRTIHLCLGCMTARRLRGETWERVR